MMRRALNALALLGLLACSGGEPVDDGSAPAVKAPSEPAMPEVSWRLPQTPGISPLLIPTDEKPILGALAILKAVVEQHANDPNNPWAVSHGMLALGPDMKLANGEKAMDFLFREYAHIEVVRGEELIGFPKAADRQVKDPESGITETISVRVEPHTDLILKALAEGGAKPDWRVTVQGKDFTLGHLYRHSLYRTWTEGDAVGYEHFNNTPWALQSLATWAPSDLAWSAEGGRQTNLDDYTHAMWGHYRSKTAFMREAMASGRKVQKRGQGIWDYTCGGAHFFQGTGYALARGFGTDEDRAQYQEEIDVLFWRFGLELEQIESYLMQRPDYRVVLLEQRLKFTGHLVESTFKAAALGLFVPTPQQEELMKQAVGQLVATVAVLADMKVLANLDKLKSTNEQVYLDFVGDSAHAMRGLLIAMGSDLKH